MMNTTKMRNMKRDKEAVKMVIYYDDGTYQEVEFVPENKLDYVTTENKLDHVGISKKIAGLDSKESLLY